MTFSLKGIDVTALAIGGLLGLGAMVLTQGLTKFGFNGGAVAASQAYKRAYNTTYMGIITDTYALMDPYVSPNEFYTYNTLPRIENPVSTFDPSQPNFSAIGGYTPPSSLHGY